MDCGFKIIKGTVYSLSFPQLLADGTEGAELMKVFGKFGEGITWNENKSS
jgi:hypothetical protein